MRFPDICDVFDNKRYGFPVCSLWFFLLLSLHIYRRPPAIGLRGHCESFKQLWASDRTLMSFGRMNFRFGILSSPASAIKASANKKKTCGVEDGRHTGMCKLLTITAVSNNVAMLDDSIKKTARFPENPEGNNSVDRQTTGLVDQVGSQQCPAS